MAAVLLTAAAMLLPALLLRGRPNDLAAVGKDEEDDGMEEGEGGFEEAVVGEDAAAAALAAWTTLTLRCKAERGGMPRKGYERGREK